MDLGGTYYNTKPQVEALEALLQKLPDPATPAPPTADRPKPGRARQLDANQTQALIQGYLAGATTYELGAQFGIDRRTVSNISTGTACRCADAASPLAKSTTRSTSTASAGHWHESAKHLNVDHTTVLTKLRERGVPTRDSHGRPRS
ncbi:MAG: hypothetical protein ACRDRN_02180 [Sciscionella sp.]